MKSTLSRRGFLGALFGTAAIVTAIPSALAVPFVPEHEPEEDFIVPYRGRTFDAGAFYCPYIPLTMVSVRTDTPSAVSFNTRYGMVAI